MDHVAVDMNQKGIKVKESCSDTTEEQIKNVDTFDKLTSVLCELLIMEDVVNIPNNNQLGTK